WFATSTRGATGVGGGRKHRGTARGRGRFGEAVDSAAAQSKPAGISKAEVQPSCQSRGLGDRLLALALRGQFRTFRGCRHCPAYAAEFGSGIVGPAGKRGEYSEGRNRGHPAGRGWHTSRDQFRAFVKALNCGAIGPVNFGIVESWRLYEVA